jgi:ferric-dicitrate binding protein FerR (iron transport regulator)
LLRDTAQPQVYSSTVTTTTIKLADGSTVTLNKNSKLTAAATFGKEQREVTLEGEGFFEVTPDKAHPFIVHAGTLDVKVLGTAFNVNARKTDSIMVTVDHGRVRVASATSDSVILQKGEAARFTASDNIVKKIDNGNRNAFAWKTHDFDFQNTPLSEVAEQLSEVYGVRVVLKNAELKNCPVTIPLHQKSLDSILSMLEATLGVTVQRQGELYVIDGLCKSS